MSLFASKSASSFEINLNITVWALNFFDSLVGLFISLYLLISHDDLKEGCLEAIELSQNLNQYLPYEYLTSAVFLVLTFFTGPWYLTLLVVPLVVLNFKSYTRKDYKLYSITKREYDTHYNRMEM